MQFQALPQSAYASRKPSASCWSCGQTPLFRVAGLRLQGGVVAVLVPGSSGSCPLNLGLKTLRWWKALLATSSYQLPATMNASWAARLPDDHLMDAFWHTPTWTHPWIDGSCVGRSVGPCESASEHIWSQNVTPGAWGRLAVQDPTLRRIPPLPRGVFSIRGMRWIIESNKNPSSNWT